MVDTKVSDFFQFSLLDMQRMKSQGRSSDTIIYTRALSIRCSSMWNLTTGNFGSELQLLMQKHDHDLRGTEHWKVWVKLQAKGRLTYASFLNIICIRLFILTGKCNSWFIILHLCDTLNWISVFIPLTVHAYVYGLFGTSDRIRAPSFGVEKKFTHSVLQVIRAYMQLNRNG